MSRRFMADLHRSTSHFVLSPAPAYATAAAARDVGEKIPVEKKSFSTAASKTQKTRHCMKINNNYNIKYYYIIIIVVFSGKTATRGQLEIRRRRRRRKKKYNNNRVNFILSEAVSVISRICRPPSSWLDDRKRHIARLAEKKERKHNNPRKTFVILIRVLRSPLLRVDSTLVFGPGGRVKSAVRTRP